jgi:hypothetical protein
MHRTTEDRPRDIASVADTGEVGTAAATAM